MSDTTVSKPANPNGALMREWTFWKSTPDYPRLKGWLERVQTQVKPATDETGELTIVEIRHPYTEGQMWGCFMAGFMAAMGQAAGIADQEAESVDEGEVYIAALIAKRIRAMNEPDDPSHGSPA